MAIFEPSPNRPSHVADYADICLQALAAHDLGEQISVGGAFGLLHYLDYRSTHDVDAWWQATTTPSERDQVVHTIEDALRVHGEVRKRLWGDVISIELRQQNRTSFSFQIAERSVQLQPSVPAPWVHVLLDSLPDLLASKMVALVERGAPRDFRDIYSVCQAGLTTAEACWRLWQDRQQQSGNDADFARARLAIETHLKRIESHRPLPKIADPEPRTAAEATRTWYKTRFLHVRLD